jgi:hypothetical protein
VPLRRDKGVLSLHPHARHYSPALHKASCTRPLIPDALLHEGLRKVDSLLTAGYTAER